MDKWTNTQIEWMLDSDNKFYYFMTVALHECTGKSLYEILKMEWEDISPDIQRKLRKHIIIHDIQTRHGLILKNADGTAITPEQFANAFNAYCTGRNLDIRL